MIELRVTAISGVHCMDTYFHRAIYGPQFRRTEEYEYEAIRLKSFCGWSKTSPARPIRLAKQGFFYTGQEDIVLCFACDLLLCGFAPDISIEDRHQTGSPECPMVLGNSAENIAFTHQVNKSCGRLSQIANETTAVGDIYITDNSNGNSDVNSVLDEDLKHTRYRERFVENLDTNLIVGRNSCNLTADELNFEIAGDTIGASCRLGEVNQQPTAYGTWPRSDTAALSNAVQHYTGHPDNVLSANSVGVLNTLRTSDIERIQRNYSSSDWSSLTNDQRIKNRNNNMYHPNPNDISIKSVVDISGPPRPSAINPEYAALEARLRTFQGHWPPNRTPTIKDLAEAGLFYAGFGDGTKCFQCDIGLRNWESTDNAWIEHARWFPRCVFVRDNKGQPFIDQVQHDFAHAESQPEDEGTETSGHYRVDPRDVQARMDTPTVQRALSEGYRRDVLEGAIHRRLQTRGDDFPDLDAFYAAVEHEFMITPVIGPFEPTLQSHEPLGPPYYPPLRMTTQSEPSSVRVPAQSNTWSHLQSQSQPPRIRSAEELKQENAALRDQVMCKLCMERDVNTVFLPCGHLVYCQTCAVSLTLCPVCQQPIRGSVRTFLS